MWQKSYDGRPILYLVPTPIGNLEDITLRAINVLKEVDVIFSEDTRVTSILLSTYQIKKKLISLHEHNENQVKEKVLFYLKEGKNVALVTDRGTPIISDPGYKTVEYISNLGYNVVSLPGATAFVPALTSSGIEPQPFTFYGFLNSKDTKKIKELEELKYNKNTLIFYESPHRIEKTLELMLKIFGDRKVSISREISKKHENIYRGKLSSLIEEFDNPKGEFVIIVSGNKDIIVNDNISIVESVERYINDGMSVMDAIKIVAKERKLPKNEVYKAYHEER